jgi:hypothetical protein
MFLACDGGVGFIIALTVVHYVCGVEIVDLECSRNIRGNIIDEGVDIAFDGVEKGGEESAISVTGVEELGVADAGGV